MAKNFEHLIHKNSSVTINGSPKLPTSSQIEYGEIAVNYAKGGETISIKNANNEIVTFKPSDNFATKEELEEIELGTATALNDLNDRISSSGDDIDAELTELAQIVEDNEKVTAMALINLNNRVDSNDTQLSEISQNVEEFEEVAARAVTDLDARINELEETGIPTTLASLSDDSTHRLVTDAEKTTWNGKYSKPSSGIPDTDLSSEVQALLSLADTAVQQETQLSKGTTAGTGNAVTDISVSNHEITLTKGSTFLTEHQSIKTINNQTITGTGNINIAGLPTVTAADNGKILMVVNGAWALVSPSTIYTGSGTPSDSQGNDGDIYLQTSSN